MTYDCAIESRGAYLHAKATGDHTAENARRFLADVYEASVQKKCRSVLLELNLMGASLSMLEIYDVIAGGSLRGQLFDRIAYVDASVDRDPARIRFAETVARNRGVNVKLFHNVEEAERWLSAGDVSKRPSR
jgi:hypothetical protein